ncbi:MAG: VanZ family protein [Agathobaculum sp.]|uniref:VanZ family protein n=1 Tax=Agathobaculum sp. TaxID=2048138 RepID=UPI003D92CAE4
MNKLLLNGYELLTVLLAFAVLYGAMRHKSPACRGAFSFILLLAFAVYLCGALHYTGAGTLYELLRRGFVLRPAAINLLPFSRRIDVAGYLLNIVLLLPFGMLAPLIWPRLRRIGRTAAAGALFSLLIEISQLFTSRRPDVDDLLLNTLGAVLGWLLYRLLPARLRERQQACPFSPAWVVALLFLGRFLLFDELGAVSLLYF